jgi:hypothetical protein
MYTVGIQLGKQRGITQVRGAYKRPFEGKAVRRSEQDPYAYLEARSGEYNEEEKKMISDPYADGWAWHDSGKHLTAFVVSRWLSSKAKAEFTKLFEMGFRDAEELK